MAECSFGYNLMCSCLLNLDMLSIILSMSPQQASDIRTVSYLTTIINSVPTAVVVVDKAGKIVLVNTQTERLFGYTRDELLGAQIDMLVPERFRSSHPAHRAGFVHNPNARPMGAGRDLYALRKDGSQFPVEIGLNPINTQDGLFVVSAIVDITERKRHTIELQEVVAAERNRLARDLHDAVTQTLFSTSLIAEILPELWEVDVDEAKKSTEELRQLTRGALAEMRTLLLELRPATLLQVRLSELIKQLCEAFVGRSRLPIVLNIEGDRDLPPEVQVAFYRVAQESLNNVFKYARATQVDVRLALLQDSVHFETHDNGIGFDISASKPTSLGLGIMHERAESIGADLRITSTPGSGTHVVMTWQQPSNKEHE
jgi:PAS domain S-box-containing protein